MRLKQLHMYCFFNLKKALIKSYTYFYMIVYIFYITGCLVLNILVLIPSTLLHPSIRLIPMIAPQDVKTAALPFLMRYVFQYKWFELMFSPSLCLEQFLSASVLFAHTVLHPLISCCGLGWRWRLRGF